MKSLFAWINSGNVGNRHGSGFSKAACNSSYLWNTDVSGSRIICNASYIRNDKIAVQKAGQTQKTRNGTIYDTLKS